MRTIAQIRGLVAGFALAGLGALGLPASAGAETFCVGSPPGCTGTSYAGTGTGLQTALDDADANSEADLVRVGPGSYIQAAGFAYDATSGLPVEIAGSGSSGPGETVLSASNATATILALTGNDSAAHDLRIEVPATASANYTGLSLQDRAEASGVAVTATASPSPVNVIGLNLGDGTAFRDGSVALPEDFPYFGARPTGAATLERSTIQAWIGVLDVASSSVVARRLHVKAAQTGIWAASTGVLTVDDCLVDLGNANASGLMVFDNGNSLTGAMTMNADHVTVVGGGGGSSGAWVTAANPSAMDEASPTHNQDATLNLTNSIISGPSAPYVAQADNADVATISNDYSFTPGNPDFDEDFIAGPAVGTVTHNITHQVPAVLPIFVSSTDFHPLPDSELVDGGDPTATPTLVAAVSALDLDGDARIQDGDGDGIARTDVGAYELPDTFEPTTKIIKGPKKKTRKRRATFKFSSNEGGATFECKLDKRAFKPCSSAKAYKKLKRRKHTFRVRATDAFGNVDSTPAVKRWRIRRKRS